jgi:hypothetical protein
VDGRLIAFLIGILAPAILLAVTVVWFASNPLAIVGLILVMALGGFYVVSYAEEFGTQPSSILPSR